MTKIKTARTAEGEKFYYLGHTQAVVDDNGNNIEDLLAEQEEKIELLNDNTGISDYPEFSTSKTYKTGTIVRHEGALFKFTSNHEPGIWDLEEVKSWSINAESQEKLTELASEVGNIESDLYQTNTIVKGREDSVFELTSTEIRQTFELSQTIKKGTIIVLGKMDRITCRTAMDDEDYQEIVGEGVADRNINYIKTSSNNGRIGDFTVTAKGGYGLVNSVEDIKSETSKIKNEISEINDKQLLLIDAPNYTEGKVLYGYEGGNVDDERFCVSEKILINGSDYPSGLIIDYGLFDYSSNIKILSQYSTDGFIANSSYSATSGATSRLCKTIPADTKYIIISFVKGYEGKVIDPTTNKVIWKSGVNKGLVTSVEQLKNDVELLKENEGASLNLQNGWRTSKIINPQYNIHKDRLKILEIGNSFSNFPITYLQDIVNSAIGRGDIESVSDIAHYNLIRTGSSYKTWYDLYHGKDTPETTKYYFKCNSDEGNIISSNHNTIYCPVTDNSLMIDVLTNHKWDIILIHQQSIYSAECEEWEGNGDGGYLKEFIMLIKKFQPQSSLGFTFVHSVASFSDGNAEQDTQKRWANIARGVAKMKAEYGMDFIIPWGTALENLRISSLNDTTSELTHDGSHPALGLVCYALSLVYFECIYGWRYGVSLMNDDFTRDFSQEREEVSYPTGVIDVTDDNRIIAQTAAMLACYNMYEIKNPDDFISIW